MKRENKYLFKILKKTLRGVAPNIGIAATYRQFAAMICANFFIPLLETPSAGRSDF